jgi:hypothetical protein
MQKDHSDSKSETAGPQLNDPAGAQRISTRLSTGRPAHIPTAQQMEMDMPDNLTTGFVTIIHNSEPVLGKTHIMGNFTCNLKNMPDQIVISSGEIESGPDMFARHNQEMVGGLGINVLKHD